jgi:hypothetical protein
MHCKACDAPLTTDTYETPHDGWQEEILCPHCIAASKVNMPEDYYEYLWLDKHGHPSHVVISPIIIELEEAHGLRAAERQGDTGTGPVAEGTQ